MVPVQPVEDAETAKEPVFPPLHDWCCKFIAEAVIEQSWAQLPFVVGTFKVVVITLPLESVKTKVYKPPLNEFVVPIDIVAPFGTE